MIIPAPYKTYNGGKSGSGTYQTIINCIPPMKIFVSPFIGNGGIERRIKLPAQCFFADIDADVVNAWKKVLKDFNNKIILKRCNGMQLIDTFSHNDSTTFIYCDPPYLFDTRTSQRNLYTTEWNYDNHVDFLQAITKCTCNVAISHPAHILYENMLKGWKFLDYQYMSRSGKKKWDRLWMNYKTPLILQDYRYLGSNYRERELIKNKTTRYMNKLQALPPNQLISILSATIEKYANASVEIVNNLKQ